MSELIITDITSLGAGKVCIAGLIGDRTARLNFPNPTEAWVAAMGITGPGSIIQVQWQPRRLATRPHIEDGVWDLGRARTIASLTEDALAERLKSKAVPSVRDAFGQPWFTGKNGNCAFRPGVGSRSLATVRVSALLVSAPNGRPRVAFRDSAGDEWYEVPFQDLAVRTHFLGCGVCQANGSYQLQAEFGGGPALLRIGVTRPWRAEDHEPACWLQVNHIFLDPCRRNHFTFQRHQAALPA